MKTIFVDNDIYLFNSKTNELNIIENNCLIPECTEPFSISKALSYDEYKWQLENCQSMLVLSLTTRCNMRCTYCGYADERYHDLFSFKNMDFYTAKRGIDSFLESSYFTENPHISFYGGEPLANFQLLQKCVLYAKKRSYGRNVSFNMTTNLVLLDDNMLDFIIEHNISVSVSLDGPKFLHDRYRKTADCIGTYNEIIKKLKAIKEKDLNFFNRSISFSTVVSLPLHSKLLYDFLNSTPQVSSSFMASQMLTNSFREQMKQAGLQESNLYVEHEPADISDYEGVFNNLMTRYKPLYERQIFKPDDEVMPGGFCNIGIKKSYLSVDGNYYACEKVDEGSSDNIIGDIEYGTSAKLAYDKRMKVYELQKTKCRHCWAVRFCSICYTKLDNALYSSDVCDAERQEVENVFQNYIKYMKSHSDRLIELFDSITLIS